MIWVVDVRISISLAATSLFLLACCRVYRSIYLLGWIAPRYQSACHFFSVRIRPSHQESHLGVDTRALIRFASFGSCLSAAFLPIALFWADIADLSLCCNYSNRYAREIRSPPGHTYSASSSPFENNFSCFTTFCKCPPIQQQFLVFYFIFIFIFPFPFPFPLSSSFTNSPTKPLDPADPSKTHNKDNSPTESPTQTLSAAPTIS